MTTSIIRSDFPVRTFRVVFLSQLVLGVLLALGTPLLGALDELYHWQRAVEISEGELFAHRAPDGQFGGWIDRGAFEYHSWFFDRFVDRKPIAVIDAWREARALAPVTAERVTALFPSTATFAPIAYFPQAIGIGLARTVGANMFTQIVAGRIANLLVFLALIWQACRILPGARYSFLALVFIPTALHLASSLSADALNLALPVLLIAFCMRLRADAAFALSPGRRWSIAGLVIACGLLKLLYVLFALAIFLIPAAKFRDGPARWRFISFWLVASIAISAAWNHAYPFVPGIYWGNGADPGATVRSILANPLHAIATIATTAHQMWFEWFRGYFGAIGGEGGFAYFIDTERLWPAIWILAGLALVDGLPRRDLRQSGLFAAVAIVFAIAILFAFYIGFTRFGAGEVEGINGRYFFLFYLLMGWAVTSMRPLSMGFAVLRMPLFLAAIGWQATVTLSALSWFRTVWVY